jgi:hypothetical protein
MYRLANHQLQTEHYYHRQSRLHYIENMYLSSAQTLNDNVVHAHFNVTSLALLRSNTTLRTVFVIRSQERHPRFYLEFLCNFSFHVIC